MDAEKLGAKALIVFGETGCGKSTFLNAIVNYLAEV
jgi:ABC-type lipoprotein export system ATPase subunit